MLIQFNNYLNSQGIVPLQNNCTYSNTNPLRWQNGQYLFINDLSFVTNRDILYSNTCKYMEKVTFNTNGNNFAIGYNPASNSNTTIDKSNYLISTYLSNLGYPPILLDTIQLHIFQYQNTQSKPTEYAKERSECSHICRNG